MKAGTLVSATSKFLCIGLLALAGVIFSTNHASAQAQEACPLPAGVTPIAPPSVTAQHVESGTGSLMDFALGSRARFLEQAGRGAGQSQYLACLIRQANSGWRSGSTYLVTLTIDGRVYIHAQDMSLSGRKLKPVIYGAILGALRIDPAELANRVTALAAFNAAGAHDGGPFNIPGASGYASVYPSLRYRAPIVMLAGFDLNETHLVPFGAEDIDHGDPAVTAADVVDRATLKDFVTQAGNHFIELVKTGDPADLSKARTAMRDPNGPWRHGSVYIYVLNLKSETILFHAAFPDRFENRPLTPTVRDAVTGEFILPQVIEAAKSDPEGGFVEYYFDDPTDATDSADIPKVGYARKFDRQLPRRDGSTAELSFIVGSGFYGSASEVVATDPNAVIETVLPQVMRAMTASTVDAVSGRIERATSDTASAAALSFGGASTLSDALLANEYALGNGNLDFSRLLANSSFTLPLNATGNGGSGLFGDLTFWGSGDYRNIAGGDPQSVDYDGSVVSANLGVDTRLGADMLAGVALSQARGTVDYTASNASGELTTSLTSVNPYVGWQMAGGMNLWAAAGYGTGEVEIDDASADTQSSDLTQQMVAVGASGPLMTSDRMFEGGTTSLYLKGEAAFAQAEIDGSGTLESTTLNASQQRLVLEGVYDQRLASGATFSPSLVLGIRNDGGDGETGTGVETGAGLRYSDAASGLTIEGRARTLLSHSGDYEEWGVSGLVRIDPGASGQGLAFSLQPAWGRTASGVEQLWESGVSGGAALADRGAGRVHAQIAYGIGDTWGANGMLTPYTGVWLSDEGSRRLSIGGRYDIGP
ncbi:MAG: autotransporter domain-containing protein [Rhodospirillales bacterium]|nr:autotransporter domain-containing protein [Rhodospirillales bacterium]MDE0382231.1 autotransporter domain-containing protein [Rhodospirillales bacterium]